MKPHQHSPAKRRVTRLARKSGGPGISRDITERKQAEEGLRQSERRLRLALEGGRMGQWDWDLVTDRLVVDEKGFELMGLPQCRGAVEAEVFYSQVHSDDLQRLLRIRRHAMKQGTEFHHEVRVTSAGGVVRWVAVRGRVFRPANGRPQKMTGVTYDITERKKAEQQLRTQTRTLEERVRERTAELEAMNQTLHEEIRRRRQLEREILDVSEREQRRIGQDLHDGLCQMTTATAMMSEGLHRDLADRSLSQEARTAHRITELIQAIGDEARRLSRGLSPVTLEADGLTLALEELAISTTKLFHIPCRLRCAAPVLIADHIAAIHLFRIAQEAVNNAVRHGKPQRIEVGLQRNRAGLVLTVTDDGRGLPSHIPSGCGMGLHVMRYRADMVGGTIRFERGPKRGTTVTCLMPSRVLKKGLATAG
jgi:PAS domain S-box-containing protein